METYTNFGDKQRRFIVDSSSFEFLSLFSSAAAVHTIEGEIGLNNNRLAIIQLKRCGDKEEYSIINKFIDGKRIVLLASSKIDADCGQSLLHFAANKKSIIQSTIKIGFNKIFHLDITPGEPIIATVDFNSDFDQKNYPWLLKKIIQ